MSRSTSPATEGIRAGMRGIHHAWRIGMSNAGGSNPQVEQTMTATAMFAACVGLGMPLGMLVLATIHPSIMWRRHSDVIPLACLASGVLPSIVAVVLSIRMLRLNPSGRAWAALALGLCALPACLAITWWLGMTVLASHPV